MFYTAETYEACLHQRQWVHNPCPLAGRTTYDAFPVSHTVRFLRAITCRKPQSRMPRVKCHTRGPTQAYAGSVTHFCCVRLPLPHLPPLQAGPRRLHRLLHPVALLRQHVRVHAADVRLQRAVQVSKSCTTPCCVCRTDVYSSIKQTPVHGAFQWACHTVPMWLSSVCTLG